MTQRFRILALSLLMFVFIAKLSAAAIAGGACHAPPRDQNAFRQELSSYAAEAITHRVAIVVGVGSFDQPSTAVDTIRNPENDAIVVADTANYSGYFTLCYLEVSLTDFDELARFTADAPPGSAANTPTSDSNSLFFYFAGHGFQHGGHVYLLPRTYQFTAAGEISTALDLSAFLFHLRPSATFLFAAIDACRANAPVLPGVQSADAPANGPTRPDDVGAGMLIQFSSGAGQIAHDVGPDPAHGAYARAFADVAQLPGIPLDTMLSNIASRTAQFHSQTPALSQNISFPDRLFHPAANEAEKHFGQAWSVEFANGGSQGCPWIVLLGLPALEADEQHAGDPRFHQMLEDLLGPLRACPHDPASTPLNVAVRIVPSGGANLATDTGSSQLVHADSYVFTAGEPQSAGALSVFAIDPATNFGGGGQIAQSALQIVQSRAQALLNALDVSRIFARSTTMTAPVIYLRYPHTAAELSAALDLQIHLDETRNARIRATGGTLKIPRVLVEALPDKGVQALLPAQLSLLVDQDALNQTFRTALRDSGAALPPQPQGNAPQNH